MMKKLPIGIAVATLIIGAAGFFLLKTVDAQDQQSTLSPRQLAAPACEVSVAMQNDYSDQDFSKLGVINDVFSMNSGAVLAPAGQSQPYEWKVDKFINSSYEEIDKVFSSYLATHPQLKQDTNDVLILDIEGPASLYRLIAFDAATQDKIIEGYKLRTKVVRDHFPNARLALWNTIYTPPDLSIEKYQARLDGYLKAGAQGAFDDIAYLLPNLYTRLGPDDEGYGGADYMEKYARFGIEYSAKITNSQGKHLPMAPAFSTIVANSGSQHDREKVNPVDTARMMQTARQCTDLDTGKVEKLIVWVGNNENTFGVNLLAFFESLKLRSCDTKTDEPQKPAASLFLFLKKFLVIEK